MLEVLVDDSCEPTPPRDVDLVVLEEKLEGSDSDDVDETICDLSWRFSPRDAMHGYGTERIGSVNEHMEECDFTINQALICKDINGWELKATTQAVLDTAEHVIRLAVYEHNEHHPLGNKLALKAVRLLSEMRFAVLTMRALRACVCHTNCTATRRMIISCRRCSWMKRWSLV